MVTAPAAARAGLARVAQIAGQVEDPELPGLTLHDLGIFRGVAVEDDGRTVVRLTPTYSGCPAVEVIAGDVRAALAEAGRADVGVEMHLAPAWSTDWITAAGRHKLEAMGIGPPAPVSMAVTFRPRCPNCGSVDTEETSHFSGTACKSLHRCRGCAEPFEAVKPL